MTFLQSKSRTACVVWCMAVVSLVGDIGAFNPYCTKRFTCVKVDARKRRGGYFPDTSEIYINSGSVSPHGDSENKFGNNEGSVISQLIATTVTAATERRKHGIEFNNSKQGYTFFIQYTANSTVQSAVAHDGTYDAIENVSHQQIHTDPNVATSANNYQPETKSINTEQPLVNQASTAVRRTYKFTETNTRLIVKNSADIIPPPQSQSTPILGKAEYLNVTEGQATSAIGGTVAVDIKKTTSLPNSRAFEAGKLGKENGSKPSQKFLSRNYQTDRMLAKKETMLGAQTVAVDHKEVKSSLPASGSTVKGIEKRLQEPPQPTQDPAGATTEDDSEGQTDYPSPDEITDSGRPIWRETTHFVCQDDNHCKPALEACLDNFLLCNSNDVRNRFLMEHNSQRNNQALLHDIANMHILSYDLDLEFVAFCATSLCYRSTGLKKIGCKHLDIENLDIDELIVHANEMYNFNVDPDVFVETTVEHLSEENATHYEFMHAAHARMGCARRFHNKQDYPERTVEMVTVCAYRVDNDIRYENIEGVAASKCIRNDGGNTDFPGLCGNVRPFDESQYHQPFTLIPREQTMYKMNGDKCDFDLPWGPRQRTTSPRDRTTLFPWPTASTKFGDPLNRLEKVQDILALIERLSNFVEENMTVRVRNDDDNQDGKSKSGKTRKFKTTIPPMYPDGYFWMEDYYTTTSGTQKVEVASAYHFVMLIFASVCYYYVFL